MKDSDTNKIVLLKELGRVDGSNASIRTTTPYSEDMPNTIQTIETIG